MAPTEYEKRVKGQQSYHLLSEILGVINGTNLE
ncbi:hypothetical protein FOFC_08186 [Fusarium oxysporum]|nr:hypothetical protein FOFC_08186 [Fusarium oxysporum]